MARVRKTLAAYRTGCSTISGSSGKRVPPVLFGQRIDDITTSSGITTSFPQKRRESSHQPARRRSRRTLHPGTPCSIHPVFKAHCHHLQLSRPATTDRVCVCRMNQLFVEVAACGRPDEGRTPDDGQPGQAAVPELMILFDNLCCSCIVVI